MSREWSEWLAQAKTRDPEEEVRMLNYRDWLAVLEAAVAARPEGVTIKLELLDFLSGIAALDGVWFGDEHPKYMGKYWWRRYLPDAPHDESPPPMNSGGEKT